MLWFLSQTAEATNALLFTSGFHSQFMSGFKDPGALDQTVQTEVVYERSLVSIGVAPWGYVRRHTKLERADADVRNHFVLPLGNSCYLKGGLESVEGGVPSTSSVHLTNRAFQRTHNRH